MGDVETAHDRGSDSLEAPVKRPIARNPRGHRIPVTSESMSSRISRPVTALLGAVLLSVLPPSSSPATALQQPGASDVYERGMALKAQGDWQGALSTWQRARRETDGYDPRIGIAFIETVTEELAFEHYETASEMLLWGFSGTDIESHRETVAAEVARLLPILPARDTAEWNRRLESGDPGLLREIKRFWIEKDPTPSTDTNERLLEHWERIAYARDHFARNRSSPYGTDDRGTIYVRFGPPDKEQAGVMNVEFELQIRARRFVDRDVLRRYDAAPSYEIWAYNDLNPEDVTWYLFGNENGSGPFRLLEGPWDLISDAARSAGSRQRTPGQIRAAHYMELFYYSELAHVGGPFAQRFSELESVWDRAQARVANEGPDALVAPPEGALETVSTRFRQEDQIGPRYPARVPVLSEYEGVRRELELVAMPLRVLSAENEPQIAITALSAPRVRLGRGASMPSQGASVAERRVDHTLIVRDEALEEIGRLTEEVSSSLSGDISTFLLRHVDRELHYTVLAVSQRGDDDIGVETLAYPGQAHFTTGPPLDPNPSRLEVSDVVTGVDIPPGMNPEGLTFPVIPSRTIWQGDPLRVYLEVYHLARDENDVGHFRTDFRVVSLDGQGRVDTSRAPVTLSVDLESGEPTSRRMFDINVGDLPIGDYRLEVVISDLVSGQSKTRTAPVRIIP